MTHYSNQCDTIYVFVCRGKEEFQKDFGKEAKEPIGGEDSLFNKWCGRLSILI